LNGFSENDLVENILIADGGRISELITGAEVSLVF
jgi:hypothetical protein